MTDCVVGYPFDRFGVLSGSIGKLSHRDWPGGHQASMIIISSVQKNQFPSSGRIEESQAFLNSHTNSWMQVTVSLRVLGSISGGDANPRDGRGKITDPNPHGQINLKQAIN